MAEGGQSFWPLLRQVALALLAFVGTVYLHFTLFHLDGPSKYPHEPIELWQQGASILAGVGWGVLALGMVVNGSARRRLLLVGIGTILGGLAGFALIPLYLG